MSAITKKVPTCLVSIVVVEQAFSAGDDILDDSKYSLTLESLKAQVCLDDWIRAKRRAQEVTR